MLGGVGGSCRVRCRTACLLQPELCCKCTRSPPPSVPSRRSQCSLSAPPGAPCSYAYMLSSGGSDWRTIHIKSINQETGETTGEPRPACGSTAGRRPRLPADGGLRSAGLDAPQVPICQLSAFLPFCLDASILSSLAHHHADLEDKLDHVKFSGITWTHDSKVGSWVWGGGGTTRSPCRPCCFAPHGLAEMGGGWGSMGAPWAAHGWHPAAAPPSTSPLGRRSAAAAHLGSHQHTCATLLYVLQGFFYARYEEPETADKGTETTINLGQKVGWVRGLISKAVLCRIPGYSLSAGSSQIVQLASHDLTTIPPLPTPPHSSCIMCWGGHRRRTCVCWQTLPTLHTCLAQRSRMTAGSAPGWGGAGEGCNRGVGVEHGERLVPPTSSLTPSPSHPPHPLPYPLTGICCSPLATAASQ